MKKLLVLLLSALVNTVAFTQQHSLQYFIEQGISNSPLLKDFKNQVKLNMLDSMLILATQKPQVSFSSNELYAPVIKGYGYDNAVTNGANVSALVGVSKSLLNKSPNKIQFANINLMIQSVRNNATISGQDLIKTITDQYIVVYGDMLQVKATTAVQDMMKKQDAVLKRLTQKNVYRQVDYLSFHITVQQNDFKLRQQTNQFKNDYTTLNYLVGNVDTTFYSLEEPSISAAILPNADSSVFFQKYYLDSLALVNSKKILDLSYRPKLSVFADAGYNSSMAYLPYKNFGTSVGLNLIIPIFDGKQKQLQYTKVDLQENTRQENKRFFTNQYTQQILQLQKQLKAITDLADEIAIQLKYIETLLSVNEKLLQAGEVKIYDYIMSITNLLNAKSMINDNLVNKWQIINQINYWNK